MIKRIFSSWNNQRRSLDYWTAVAVLAINPLNYEWWMDLEQGPLVIFRDFVYLLADLLILGGHAIPPLVMTVLTPGLISVIAVLLINSAVGSLPERRAPGRLLAFTAQPAFLADVAVGLILSGMGLHTLKQSAASKDFPLVGNLLIVLVCLLMLQTYWAAVFPVKSYHRVYRTLKKEYCADVAWFCVSNAQTRVSVFNRFPDKGDLGVCVLDRQDLKLLREKKRIRLAESDFRDFVIIVDRSHEFSRALLDQTAQILKIPHARILVCYTGRKHTHPSVAALEKMLQNNENVSYRECDDLSDKRHLGIQDILSSPGPEFSGGRRVPLCYLRDETLKQTYLHVSTGPELCLAFMQKICCKLDAAPGIYALFDFIDLQYRIQLAVEQPWHREQGIDQHERFAVWAKANSYSIGNIRKMAELLRDTILANSSAGSETALSTRRIFSDVFSTDDFKLIRKYLSNYEIEYDRPGYQTILYLTANLRNILRGHGYFDVSDTEALFELIMKLAMMNLRLLSTNSVTLRVDDQSDRPGQDFLPVSGAKSEDGLKSLSPFLAATADGNILCFNNYHLRNKKQKTGQIEYINYLNGTIILPHFQSDSYDPSLNQCNHETESRPVDNPNTSK